MSIYLSALMGVLAMFGAHEGVSAGGSSSPSDAPVRFIPLDGLQVAGPAEPSDAEMLAVGRFVHRIRRITGIALPVVWSDRHPGPCLLVGNRSTLADLVAERGYPVPEPRDGEDMARQSYVVDLVRLQGSRGTVLVAAGLGNGRGARDHLGTGYALGELRRRLEKHRGRWGFALPAVPIVRSPAVANRTLYIMNSNNRNPGLSLEYFDDEEMADYVDTLVEARFSRVCFWQWRELYLYPGNYPTYEEARRHIHRAMRRFFDHARRRGLEVYHMLTPSHAGTELLPPEPRFRATGYYAPFSICWSQPEARDLALKMAQVEMEYYGPVDGYVVWFYDPGGCFCEECATHQAERIFDQLMSVVRLAQSISPGARFQAGLWPTWAFSREKAVGFPGRGYTDEEVASMVRGFLRLCRQRFGPRELTISDSCEADTTNMYNGLVDPREFRRNGFLYTVLGMASEQMYPFAPFRLRYIHEQMRRAHERGLDECQIFLQYSATNLPAVIAFADSLYDPGSGYEAMLERVVASLAAGEARRPMREYLEAVDETAAAANREDLQRSLRRMEKAAATFMDAPEYVASKDWLRGHVLAYRFYAELAAADEAAFDGILARFREELGAIPMYSDFAKRSLQPHVVRMHLKQYWHALAKQ